MMILLQVGAFEGAPRFSHITRIQFPCHIGVCELCGARMGVCQGDAVVTKIKKGRSWPDAIKSTDIHPFFTSVIFVKENVVDVLNSEGVTGFVPWEIGWALGMAFKLPKIPPNYCYLQITGTIKIDPAASVYGFTEGTYAACHSCGIARFNKPPWRLVPIESSWDGSDFFQVRGGAQIGCTTKIIELARKHRWTNFRFRTFDLPFRHAALGDIDYLVPEWPPRWYPEIPSLTRPLEHWTRELGTSVHPYSRSLHEAFLEYGDEGRRIAEDRLLHGTPLERWNAAKAVQHIYSDQGIGEPIPPALKEAIDQQDELAPFDDALRALNSADPGMRRSAAYHVSDWHWKRGVAIPRDAKPIIMTEFSHMDPKLLD